MKDVFMELMVQIQGKEGKEIQHKHLKNKSNLLSHTKSNHTTTYNSNNDKQQGTINFGHIKDKDNKENRKLDQGTLKTLKNV